MIIRRYQVRFGLLQAGYYGTPQSRVRFFLIAALDSHILPALPQPTHDFPVADALELKFSNDARARPIQTGRGLAPHRFVTVDDAISDLPRFHWWVPRLLSCVRLWLLMRSSLKLGEILKSMAVKETNAEQMTEYSNSHVILSNGSAGFPGAKSGITMSHGLHSRGSVERNVLRTFNTSRGYL